MTAAVAAAARTLESLLCMASSVAVLRLWQSCCQ